MQTTEHLDWSGNVDLTIIISFVRNDFGGMVEEIADVGGREISVGRTLVICFDK